MDRAQAGRPLEQTGSETTMTQPSTMRLLAVLVVGALSACGGGPSMPERGNEIPAGAVADSGPVLPEEARVRVGFAPDLLVFLNDARIAIVGRSASWTSLWDLVGSPQAPLDVPALGQVLAVSRDQTNVAACTRGGAVALWRADPLEPRVSLVTLQDTLYPIAAFSPDGRSLAVTNRRDEIELWDTESAALTATLVGHNSNLFDITFAPDGRLLATAGGLSGGSTDADSCVKVWDTATGALVASLPTIDIGDNHATAFTADGGRLFSGGPSRLVAWSTATWERVYDSGPSYPGNAGLAISPDGRLLALASWAGSIRLVDLGTMSVLRDLPAPATPVDVCFSPDGSRIAACFQDQSVIVWRTLQGSR